MTKKKTTTKKKKKTMAVVKLTTKAPSPLNQNQLLFILQKTPKNHIYTRPAKGGGTWNYVTGIYVKKMLNYCFGWMWDFQVIDKGREGNQIWVQGRLTIKNKTGKPMIIKEQFGRADVKVKRGTTDPLDYGNDLKAASTDALKKCASELGIASDIYGGEEFKEIQSIDKGFIPPKNEMPKEKVIEAEVINGQPKLDELRSMLKGNTDNEKIDDLNKRTEIVLKSFDITEKHCSILIANLLNAKTK